MKIIINNEQVDVSAEADQVLDFIKQYLEENQLLLETIVLDGQVVPDEFLEFYEKNKKENSTLEVHAMSFLDAINLLKENYKEQNRKIQLETEKLSDLYYGLNKATSDTNDVVSLIEKIYLFFQDLEESVGVNQDLWGVDLEFIKRFPSVVSEIYLAMEEKDLVYIADLLHFEMSSGLESIFWNEK